MLRNKIKEVAFENGHSIYSLSKALGSTGVAHLYNVCNHKSTIGIDKAFDIAYILGVSVEDLFEYTPPDKVVNGKREFETKE